MAEPSDVSRKHPRYPWVSVSDEARRRGENIDVFRRWLKAVNEAAGGTLLRSFERPGQRRRKLYVNTRALEAHAGPSASERDAELQAMRGRLEELEIRVRTLTQFRRETRAVLSSPAAALEIARRFRGGPTV